MTAVVFDGKFFRSLDDSGFVGVYEKSPIVLDWTIHTGEITKDVTNKIFLGSQIKIKEKIALERCIFINCHLEAPVFGNDQSISMIDNIFLDCSIMVVKSDIRFKNNDDGYVNYSLIEEDNLFVGTLVHYVKKRPDHYKIDFSSNPDDYVSSRILLSVYFDERGNKKLWRKDNAKDASDV